MAVLPPAILLGTIWLAGGVRPPPAVPPTCTCAEAKELNGWCHLRGLGYVAFVPIRSKLLWEVLDAHGHDLDLSNVECSSCLRAIEEDGFCEEHRVGFVDELTYLSRLTYELARGKLIRPEQLSCPVCRQHAETHGWCETCRRGLAGHFALVDRTSYEAVLDALEILALANAAAERCEHCAMAIITNTECPFCRITYKDGEPVPATARDGQGDRP